MSAMRIVLADDYPLVRRGIRALVETRSLDMVIVGEASNGRDLLDLAMKVPADIYIMDISMPLLNGIETTERLLRKNPAAKVIILSMHTDRNSFEKCVQAGVKGFVLKANSPEELITAIHHVALGKSYYSPQMSKYLQAKYQLSTSASSASKIVDLTRREKEVLQLIAEGFNNREIGEKLGVAMNTVHIHRNNIMRKLDIHRHAELVRYALKEGISQLF